MILLKGLLDDKGIQTLVQNDYQLGISAGLAGGTVNTIRLKVHATELEQTKPILEDFIQNQQ